MRKLLFRALGGAPILLLLADCCGNTACTYNDSLADALYFSFGSNFTRTELDTVYIYRYSKANPSQAPDVLPLPRRSRVPTNLRSQVNFNGQDTTGLVIISNSAPFSLASNTNLSSYTYVLALQKDGSRTAFYRDSIYGISLLGGFEADGCCTYYRNRQKIVHLQGGGYTGDSRTVTDASGSNGSDLRVPVVTRFAK